MVADSCLPPTPYLQQRSTSSGSWSETSAGPGFGGPRSRQGAHNNVENIARRLVPLTSASCKEDGRDWREMSVDVGQRSGVLLDGARDRVGQTKTRLRIARRIIGHSERRAPAVDQSPAAHPSVERAGGRSVSGNT